MVSCLNRSASSEILMQYQTDFAAAISIEANIAATNAKVKRSFGC